MGACAKGNNTNHCGKKNVAVGRAGGGLISRRPKTTRLYKLTKMNFTSRSIWYSAHAVERCAHPGFKANQHGPHIDYGRRCAVSFLQGIVGNCGASFPPVCNLLELRTHAGRRVKEGNGYWGGSKNKTVKDSQVRNSSAPNTRGTKGLNPRQPNSAIPLKQKLSPSVTRDFGELLANQ